ncbi:hypothetical protein ASZ90_019089 [hydrocarbon metagenome]|uniref:Uncharacterized protein n=1 Tax=hydrocarbon metagenome TaxID=938273 RepID=A0A0W8E4D9_9ZZZZ
MPLLINNTIPVGLEHYTTLAIEGKDIAIHVWSFRKHPAQEYDHL